MQSKIAALAATGALLAGFACAAGAADAYPQRSIRLIIPYPPGGAGDIVGRMLSVRLGESLGQQIVIDNRGGGAQLIATELASRAPADGYTLFLASATHGINPGLQKKLPYDTLKDFSSITLVTGSPLVFTWKAALVAALLHALPLLVKSARAALESVDRNY